MGENCDLGEVDEDEGLCVPVRSGIHLGDEPTEHAKGKCYPVQKYLEGGAMKKDLALVEYNPEGANPEGDDPEGPREGSRKGSYHYNSNYVVFTHLDISLHKLELLKREIAFQNKAADAGANVVRALSAEYYLTDEGLTGVTVVYENAKRGGYVELEMEFHDTKFSIASQRCYFTTRSFTEMSMVMEVAKFVNAKEDFTLFKGKENLKTIRTVVDCFDPKYILRNLDKWYAGPAGPFLEKVFRSVHLFHRANIFHHDLHGGNVFVHPDTFDLRFIDFGFATTFRETFENPEGKEWSDHLVHEYQRDIIRRLDELDANIQNGEWDEDTLRAAMLAELTLPAVRVTFDVTAYPDCRFLDKLFNGYVVYELFSYFIRSQMDEFVAQGEEIYDLVYAQTLEVYKLFLSEKYAQTLLPDYIPEVD